MEKNKYGIGDDFFEVENVKEIIFQQKKVYKNFIPNIPLELYKQITQLGFSTTVLFTFLWFQHKLQKTNDIKVTNQKIAEFNINRSTKCRALKKLEAAGFIKIKNQKRGSSVEVTLIIENEG